MKKPEYTGLIAVYHMLYCLVSQAEMVFSVLCSTD